MIQLRHHHLLLILLALYMLSACVSTPKVDSLEDGIAVGYLNIERVAKSGRTAYENQWIDENQKNLLVSKLQQAHDTLQDAQAFVALSKPVEAKDALEYAEAVLIQLQRQLQEASP